MDKKCICCHAEELSSVEIAYIESIHCAVGLYLERDEIENYLLNVYSSDGTEFKVKINYCPMCGRKLNEKSGWEPNEKLKELLQ
jgi:uncharacterized protein with PIN domain